MRNKKEVQDAQQKFHDILWYARFLASTTERPEEAIIKAKAIEQQYDADDLSFFDPFDLGTITGKLSALRWVLGTDWDDLDT